MCRQCAQETAILRVNGSLVGHSSSRHPVKLGSASGSAITLEFFPPLADLMHWLQSERLESCSRRLLRVGGVTFCWEKSCLFADYPAVPSARGDGRRAGGLRHGVDARRTAAQRSATVFRQPFFFLVHSSARPTNPIWRKAICTHQQFVPGFVCSCCIVTSVRLVLWCSAALIALCQAQPSWGCSTRGTWLCTRRRTRRLWTRTHCCTGTSCRGRCSSWDRGAETPRRLRAARPGPAPCKV